MTTIIVHDKGPLSANSQKNSELMVQQIVMKLA